MKIADNEARDKKYRREGTAEALRLKKPATAEVEEYYPLFIDMVKNLLDGKKAFHHFIKFINFRVPKLDCFCKN